MPMVKSKRNQPLQSFLSSHPSYPDSRQKKYNNMTNELICGLTPDQLNELKAKHGRLSLVTVTEGDDKYEGIFKEPTMDALSAITALSKQDEVKASLALFDNCLLSCDEVMKKRPRVRLSAIAQLSEIMKPLEGHIKNL